MARPICYRKGDLDYCATAFGKKKGEIGYKPECDVNGDGEVDIKDMAQMGKLLCVEPACYTMDDLEEAGKLFGKIRGAKEWNSFYDVNDDGIIDIKDISYMGARVCAAPPKPPAKIELPQIAIEDSNICLTPLALKAGALLDMSLLGVGLKVPWTDITLTPKLCVNGEPIFNAVMGFLDILAGEFYG